MANAIYDLARKKALSPIANLFVTGATNASPIEITTSKDHGLATADSVSIEGVGGNTNANGQFTITVTGADTFTLDGTTGNGAYTSGGEVLLSDALLKKLPYLIRWGNGSGEEYGDDIKAVLVNVTDTGGSDPATVYTADLVNDEFLSDIPAGARFATSSNFATKTDASPVGGVADADDIVFASVGPSGATIEAMVIYKDTGTDATSSLIAYIDTATGLSVTANGGPITVQFDSGGNRIFKL